MSKFFILACFFVLSSANFIFRSSDSSGRQLATAAAARQLPLAPTRQLASPMLFPRHFRSSDSSGRQLATAAAATLIVDANTRRAMWETQLRYVDKWSDAETYRTLVTRAPR